MGRKRLLIGAGLLLAVVAVVAVVAVGRLADGHDGARPVVLPTIPTLLAVAPGALSGVLVGGDAEVTLFAGRGGHLVRTVALAPAGSAGYVASAIALNPAGDRAVVGACDTFATTGTIYGRVSIIRTATGQIERTVPLTMCPLALAIDERHGHIVVAGVAPTCTMPVFAVSRPLARGKREVWRTLPVTCAHGAIPVVAASLAPVTEDGATGLLSPTGTGIGLLALLDARGGAIVHTTILPPASDVALDRAAGHILVAGYRAASRGAVSVVDAGSGALRLVAAVGRRPVALALDGASGHLFAANDGDGTVSVLDTRRGRVLRTVRVRPHPQALVADGPRGHVFVASAGPRDAAGNPSGAGSVSMLDTRSGRVVRTTGVGLLPAALALVARGRRVLVLNASLGGGVSVLDGRTGGRVRTLPVCGWPHTLAVDPTTGRAIVGSSVFTVYSDPCGPPAPVLDGLMALRYVDGSPPESGRLSLLPPVN